MTKQSISTKQLVETIVEAIFQKKGQEVVDLDLSNLEHAVCDNFVICDAESDTQVGAIAHAVERHVKTELHQTAWRRSGYENAQWVLLDYLDVVVHIFQKPYREFYDLEALWADAPKTHHEDNVFSVDTPTGSGKQHP